MAFFWRAGDELQIGRICPPDRMAEQIGLIASDGPCINRAHRDRSTRKASFCGQFPECDVPDIDAGKRCRRDQIGGRGDAPCLAIGAVLVRRCPVLGLPQHEAGQFPAMSLMWDSRVRSTTMAQREMRSARGWNSGSKIMAFT